MEEAAVLNLQHLSRNKVPFNISEISAVTMHFQTLSNAIWQRNLKSSCQCLKINIKRKEIWSVLETKMQRLPRTL